MEAMQRAVTDLVILCCSFGMFFLMYHLYQAGNVTFDAMLLATIAMMGSFGPVTALSSLSNNLNQTLASGERVLSLLEEEPMVEELEGEAALSFEGASVEDVTFAYNEEIILKDCNINMKQGKVIGICGKSGCGKSTLLKLLMRFWDVNKGNIKISEENVKEIPTKTLRNTQSYVTQETELFHDSIANNIAIGKPGAAREEIIKAAQKAVNEIRFSDPIHCSFSIYTSTTFSIQFNQFHNNINTHIHSFNANMFIRPMISMSTSSKIRTRKSLKT